MENRNIFIGMNAGTPILTGDKHTVVGGAVWESAENSLRGFGNGIQLAEPVSYLDIDSEQTTIHNRLDVESFSSKTIDALKSALGYGDVVVKCRACGQWGAVKTACCHCGSPIDPE